MRVKTRSGTYICVPDGSVVSQRKHITRNETYYVLQLRDGRSVSTTEPVDGVLCINLIGGDDDEQDHG